MLFVFLPTIAPYPAFFAIVLRILLLVAILLVSSALTPRDPISVNVLDIPLTLEVSASTTVLEYLAGLVYDSALALVNSTRASFSLFNSTPTFTAPEAPKLLSNKIISGVDSASVLPTFVPKSEVSKE